MYTADTIVPASKMRYVPLPSSYLVPQTTQASRFRNLSGTMTPPSEAPAEIVVEGTRQQMESFVRWCHRSDKGLSQIVKVVQVQDEAVTGLYDDFYVATK